MRRTNAFAADRVTPAGKVLFVLCLLMAASAYESLRIPIFGLQAHAYLLLLVPCLVHLLVYDFHRFPHRVFVALLTFWCAYMAATLPTFTVSEFFKISASIATIIAVALLVKSRGDYRIGVLGLTIAVGLLAYFAVTDPRFGSGGVQSVDVGNKNTYSLYALPPLLLAALVVTEKKRRSAFYNGALIVCSLLAIIAIAMSANRSGWLGILLIGAMVFRGNNARGILLVLAVTLVSYQWIANFGTTKVMQRRIEQTLEGTESDEKRVELILASIEILLENPLLGVSPEELPRELGHKLQIARTVAPHNVFAHLWGACGVIGFGAFFYLGYALWNWKSTDVEPKRSRNSPFSSQSILRMMLFLWIVRGLFTHEILYAPGFCFGIGLVLGLGIIDQEAEKASQNARKRQAMRRPKPVGQAPLSSQSYVGRFTENWFGRGKYVVHRV